MVGQDFGLDVVDAELRRHRLGGRPVVAGQHDDADSLRDEITDGLRRRRLDRIGDSEDPARLAVDCDEHGGRALAAQRVGLGRERLRVDPDLAKKAGVADGERASLDLADDALAGGRVKSEASASVRPFSFAAATTAAASGCSLPRARGSPRA